jgi:hypothetical protein
LHLALALARICAGGTLMVASVAQQRGQADSEAAASGRSASV